MTIQAEPSPSAQENPVPTGPTLAEPGVKFSDELAGLEEYRIDYARHGTMYPDSNFWIVRYAAPSSNGVRWDSGQGCTFDPRFMEWCIKEHPNWIIQSYNLKPAAKLPDKDAELIWQADMRDFVANMCDEHPHWFGYWYKTMSAYWVSGNLHLQKSKIHDQEINRTREWPEGGINNHI